MKQAITGATRLYAIIGDPVAQVRAPASFNAHFTEHGIDAVMVALQIAPADLAAGFAALRDFGNFDGAIVTIPHKAAFMELVDEVGETSRRVGAINAVRRLADGRWIGDMFDGTGYLGGLLAQRHDPAGKSALIVGAGGAGRALAFALCDGGATHLAISDVDGARAEALVARLARFAPGVAATVAPPDPRGFDIVANATPMGMRPDDPMPVDPDLLDPSQLVTEVVMTPAETPLLAAAKARGCATQPGRFMLDHMLPPIVAFFGL